MALQSPGLIKAANDALVAIGPDINVAQLFATDFSTDFADYGTTVKVPIASATAAEVNLNPGQGETLNDYETDSGSVNYANVVLNHQPKATFKAPAMSALGGLFTTTAATGGKVVLASVTKDTLAGLTEKCKGRVASTVLGLNPTNYAKALALLDTSAYGGGEAIRNGYIPALFGFKSVVCLRDLPNGVTGAMIPDTSVAVAARATVKDFAGFIEGDVVSDENGFPLTVTRHFSPAKRNEFLNVDVLWGAALVQADKVQYLAAS